MKPFNSKYWLTYAAFASALTLAGFMIGGGYGFGAGEQHQYQKDIATVEAFFKTHQEAVVFLTPDDRPAALFQDGVCTPYPSRVPQDHHTVFVASQWEPCSPVTLAPYEHPDQVRAKLAGLN